MNAWTHDWLHAVLHLLQTIVNQLSVHGLHETYNVTFLVVEMSVRQQTLTPTHLYFGDHSNTCAPWYFWTFLYLSQNFILFLVINDFDKTSKSYSVECQVLWSRWLPFLWEKSLHHREILFYAKLNYYAKLLKTGFNSLKMAILIVKLTQILWTKISRVARSCPCLWMVG